MFVVVGLWLMLLVYGCVCRGFCVCCCWIVFVGVWFVFIVGVCLLFSVSVSASRSCVRCCFG